MKVMRALLEWLIPASTLFGPFEQVRARVFSGLCLLLFAVGNVRAVGFLWAGDYPVALGYLLLAGTTGAAIHLVRRGWELWWPTHGTILLVWVMVTLVSAKRGGVGASLLTVYALLPIKVTFILGSRGGAFWSVVGLASVAAFAVLEGTGLKVFEDAFAESALPMDTAVALITIVGGSAIAVFFEDARRASEAAAVQAALEQASAEETAALARAEKLATVGLLAAGVGHEVNNPLTYIQSNIEHVLEELERLDGADPDLADALRDALDGSLRIAQITGDLVTYARAEEPGPTSVVRLDEAARTALDLTRHQIPPEHAVAADLPVIPAVLATEGKVVQVLVNLLLNAAHAIEGCPDGSVVLRTGYEAQQSWVEVEDNGPGVPEALRKKIFDPFFTTKEVGKGTGLGLSVSRSIMRSLGGDLVLRPGAGGGATFRLQLPATLAQAAVASDAAPPPRGDAPYRILIVDDEARLEAPMARMLRPHEVVWCDSGAQLLQTIDQDPDFDLVLVDVMMHPMPGWEVFDAVRARRPALLQRCALMTGGMFTTVAKERLRTAEVPLMDKPLSRAEVIELIQESRSPEGGAGVPWS